MTGHFEKSRSAALCSVMQNLIEPLMSVGSVTQIAGKGHEGRIGEQLYKARAARFERHSDDEPVARETHGTSDMEMQPVRSGLGICRSTQE